MESDYFGEPSLVAVNDVTNAGFKRIANLIEKEIEGKSSRELFHDPTGTIDLAPDVAKELGVV